MNKRLEIYACLLLFLLIISILFIFEYKKSYYVRCSVSELSKGHFVLCTPKTLAWSTTEFPTQLIGADNPDDSIGITTNLTYNDNKCLVSSEINEIRFRNNFKKVIGMGFFNSSVSDYMGDTERYSMMDMVASEISASLVHHLFEQNHSPEKCKFSWEYVEPDKFGNDVKRPMFDFVFSKSTWAKINWKNFRFTSIPEIADNYHSDKDFALKSGLEAMMSSAPQ
ncbi:hypothetical protein [Komagataeibacter melaceti]|uniref:hypothetical protein n=1 Tax=Komagataeibacter melaceti TaxID=2766577 RepID=UPI0011E5F9C7|nr:hypothetical protein [Komagataeibacter melaceti]